LLRKVAILFTRNDAPQVSTPVADRDQPVSRINQLLLIAWTIPSSFVALREEGDRRFSRFSATPSRFAGQVSTGLMYEIFAFLNNLTRENYQSILPTH